jgi:cysteine desulfurase
VTTYLDHAASGVPRPEAIEAMRPWLLEGYGNPSSIHEPGRRARRALDDAREAIAAAIGAGPREIVFTSGATEANSMAILGVARGPRPGSIVTTAIEHPSTLEAAEQAGRRAVLVAPGADGCVAAGSVDPAGAALVSVMLVNNETGAVQPVSEIGCRVREAGVWMHCDAVQALGKMPLDVRILPVDLLSISSHKVGGPRGAGALYVREGVRLEPLLRGGGQEFERRAGTENVAAAVGFARAVELAVSRLRDEASRMATATERLRAGLARMEGVRFNTPLDRAAPHILNVTFEGVDGEALAIALDRESIAVSTGSACASLATKPSHVLAAMGRDAAAVRGSIRFSTGPSTTPADVERVLRALLPIVARLRSIR